MFILFDIGATKMRLASSDGKKIGSVKIVSTPDNFLEAMAMFQKLAFELARGREIKAVAGGIAGSLDRKKGILFNPPNLPDWKERPVKETLQKLLGTKKIFLENDTALVGLGEAIEGAGKKHTIVAYITVSTGINGVRVVDKKLDRSAQGFEIGHQIIGGSPEKTLESYVGAAALSKKYHMPAQEIKDPMIWDIAHVHLAYGVHNTILHWSPDVVVLGGGQIRSGDISAARVAEYLGKIHKVFPKIPPIKKAALGDLGGLHGALAFLQEKIKEK